MLLAAQLPPVREPGKLRPPLRDALELKGEVCDRARARGPSEGEHTGGVRGAGLQEGFLGEYTPRRWSCTETVSATCKEDNIVGCEGEDAEVCMRREASSTESRVMSHDWPPVFESGDTATEEALEDEGSGCRYHALTSCA